MEQAARTNATRSRLRCAISHSNVAQTLITSSTLIFGGNETITNARVCYTEGRAEGFFTESRSRDPVAIPTSQGRHPISLHGREERSLPVQTSFFNPTL